MPREKNISDPDGPMSYVAELSNGDWSPMQQWLYQTKVYDVDRLQQQAKT